MALSFYQLFSAKQVNNAAADTLFTVPATPTSSILRNGRIRFSNTAGTATTIKAWGVPAAGTAADSNVILPTVSIAANSFLDFDVPILNAGAFMQAQAGAATSITATHVDGFIQS